ncbi:MAG TPA: hypothetical protein VGE25_06510 [Sediminibacterium sp.]
MLIQEAIGHVFVQLQDVLANISSSQYRQASQRLSGATIGQHVRHVIELFLCLETGYAHGVINYEKRNRDIQIETDKTMAADLLQNLYTRIGKADTSLLLAFSGDSSAEATITISTNYYRELLYNLEHTVHHMALIRVAVAEVSDLLLPDGFGVASSTLKYRASCAQ